ncbi:hypothetical protein K488DRAFT_87574 [Vararia minispora EC-137]|uniref:Uncharacterized protein n=1 Tax=Vararia minispora EC-137 TaxID=1314806 RepID=A0ACB8QG43_9AGAM|nr:hypothetical protein K488DRAFT_87574 [Vararia minispora EC-137]
MDRPRSCPSSQNVVSLLQPSPAPTGPAMDRPRAPSLPGTWPASTSNLSQSSISSFHTASYTTASGGEHIPSEPSSPSPAASFSHPADATVYHDASEAVQSPKTNRGSISCFSDIDGLAGMYGGTDEGSKEACVAPDAAALLSTSNSAHPECPPSPAASRTSRRRSGASPDVWAAAAADTNRMPSWASRSSRVTLPMHPTVADMTPRSAQSDLADISSCSSDEQLSPVTPYYPYHPCDEADLRARAIQGERDATLRLLESTDPNKSRRRPSSVLLDMLRSTPSPAALPSPSFGFMSPRPDPELPSLTNSLSTFPSTAFTSHSHSNYNNLHNTFGDHQSLPVIVLQEETSPLIHRRADRSALEIDVTRSHSGFAPSGGSPVVVLDLVEPSSPDSAHFTPPTGLITFPSPQSSQLQLDFPRSDELGEDSQGELEFLSTTAEIRSRHLSVLGDDIEDDIRLESLTMSTPHTRRNFLHKFKKIGSKVKRLFSGISLPSRPHLGSTASELVSPSTPSYLVSLQLPQRQGTSPPSRGRVSEDNDNDSVRLPAFTLTDVPQSAPRPSRFATVTPVSQSARRSRRFSMPLMFGRTLSTPPAQTVPATSASMVQLVPSEDRIVRRTILSPAAIAALVSGEGEEGGPFVESERESGPKTAEMRIEPQPQQDAEGARWAAPYAQILSPSRNPAIDEVVQTEATIPKRTSLLA